MNTEYLYDLCDIVSRKLGDVTKELRSSGSKLSSADADYVDKLAHTLKSVKAVMSMDYSNDMSPEASNDMSYGVHAYDNSYRRRRDSMGRYSSEGYSRHSAADKLRELVNEEDNPQLRNELERMLSKAGM